MWTAHAFLFLAYLLSTASSQEILVDGLQLETDVGKYGSPTDIAFSNDGTLWASDKNGILTASLADEYDAPRGVLDLRNVVCATGERGLIGVTPHFNFGTDNPYVYVTYIFKKNGNCKEDAKVGPVLRLSRFTCDTGGSLDCEVDSEEVFLDSPSLPSDHHNAGAVAFGKDGLLYATIGDGGESPTAQELFNLFGTVVRLTPENTIPADNPYANHEDSVRCGTIGGESGNETKPCQEIFANGLQNPFRFSMNPNVMDKTEFYINDVGASTWEEVSICGDGYGGANYGWPTREGPCTHDEACGGSACGGEDAFVEPEHFYGHNGDDEGAITAGTFVPEGVWPLEYDSKYLYADFVFNKLFLMDQTGEEDRTECPIKSKYTPVPIMDFPESNMVAMAFSPHDNALYFLARAFGGRLHRISHVGELNRPPQPKIKKSVLGGEVGIVIEFNATESTDPDGHSLTFEWDFDGDGVVDSTEALDTFQYNERGIYEASLKVQDGNGGCSSTSVTIGIGVHPVAEILEPANGTDFFVDQEFVLEGRATGGNIENETASMTWEVKQHHGGHFHPYLEPTVGNRVLLQPAPSPEDALASMNSYLEVILTVTNDLGLSTTVTRNVMPILRKVELSSFPEGHSIIVDNFEVNTPVTFVSWANHPLKLEAPGGHWFAWTNGGNQTQTVKLSKTSDAVIQIRALFEPSDAPIACFPAEATVEVFNIGSVPMKDVRIGDKVGVAGGKFSEVYSFGHFEHEAKVEFLAIETGLNTPLLITTDHMILQGGVYAPASLVTVGSTLTLSNGEHVPVLSIKHVLRKGAYAPFTKDGTIVVDGVVASSFVALQPDAAYLMIGGFETFSFHSLALLFEMPHRLVCDLSFVFCANEAYNDKGLSTWIELPLGFAQWLLRQTSLIKILVLIPLLVLLLGVTTVEAVTLAFFVAGFVALVVLKKSVNSWKAQSRFQF